MIIIKIMQTTEEIVNNLARNHLGFLPPNPTAGTIAIKLKVAPAITIAAI